jgi:hypothetical protein
MKPEELTGEQMDEAFFVEVYKWGLNEYGNWSDDEGEIIFLDHSSDAPLPRLHLSLDLQEEWLWPELWRVEIKRACGVSFVALSNDIFRCAITLNNSVFTAEAPTKAIAQLTAGLKALGVNE